MKWILLITFAATIFRFYLLLEFTPSCCGSDQGTYHSLAKNLVSGNGFVLTKEDDLTLWTEMVYGAKPPLYPFFLAIVYKIFGISHTTVQVMQILISALTGIIIYKIAKECFNKKVGIASLIMYSFFWETAYNSIVLLSENIYWLFLSLLAYLLAKKQIMDFKNAALIGILLGLLALTRASALTLFIPIFVWLCYSNLSRRTLGLILIIGLFLGLTLSPWIWRNYRLYNRLVPVYTDGGINFWMGYYPDSEGTYHVVKENDRNQHPKLSSIGPKIEVERDHFYYSQAILLIKNNFLYEIDMVFKKALMTFSVKRQAVWNSVYFRGDWLLSRPNIVSIDTLIEILVSYEFAILTTLFFLSSYLIIIKSRILSNGSQWLLLLFIWHLLSIAITHYETRYVVQMYPLMIPGASYLLVVFMKVLKK